MELKTKSGSLKEAKTKKASSARPRAASDRQPKAEETTHEESPGSSEKEIAFDLSAQLKDMVDALDKELKDTNPLILLGVFALGLFVGRLLPK
jgi:hypothetical protein